MSLRPARRRGWRIRAGSRGRPAFLCKHVVLVVAKQLVIHLQTRCQKADIGHMIDGGVFPRQRTRIGELELGGNGPV